MPRREQEPLVAKIILADTLQTGGDEVVAAALPVFLGGEGTQLAAILLNQYWIDRRVLEISAQDGVLNLQAAALRDALTKQMNEYLKLDESGRLGYRQKLGI